MLVTSRALAIGRLRSGKIRQAGDVARAAVIWMMRLPVIGWNRRGAGGGDRKPDRAGGRYRGANCPCHARRRTARSRHAAGGGRDEEQHGDTDGCSGLGGGIDDAGSTATPEGGDVGA